MDRETLPQWGWLVVGLLAAALIAGTANALLLYPSGLPERYGVVTTIALMAPVLVYVSIWHDDERRDYWEHSRVRIAADAAFLVAGATLGSAAVMVALAGILRYWIFDEIAGMFAGFVAAWGLFWWRNAGLYRQ